MDERAVLFGIAQDNPQTVRPEQCRYDACIAVSEDYCVHDDIIHQGIIAEGRYAVFQIEHKDVRGASVDRNFPELQKQQYQIDTAGRPILGVNVPYLIEAASMRNLRACEIKCLRILCVSNKADRPNKIFPGKSALREFCYNKLGKKNTEQAKQYTQRAAYKAASPNFPSESRLLVSNENVENVVNPPQSPVDRKSSTFGSMGMTCPEYSLINPITNAPIEIDQQRDERKREFDAEKTRLNR